MLNAYILLYQYFDNEEIKLLDQITQLQDRVLYRNGRKLSAEESQELTYAKIKLDFVRKIGSELLRVFQDL